MRTPPKIITVIDRVSRSLGNLAGLIVIVMMLHVVIDVVRRVGFRSPLPGTLDFITYWWMPSLVFLSLGAAEYARSHIRVTIVVDKVSPRVGTFVNTVAHGITLAVVVIVLYFAILGAMSSVEIRQATSGAINVPIWIPKIVMTVGLSAFLLQILATIWRELTAVIPPVFAGEENPEGIAS